MTDTIAAAQADLRAVRRASTDATRLPEALTAVADLKELQRELERQVVLSARAAGMPWQRIAAPLGRSHQALIRMYGEAAAELEAEAG